MRIFNLDWLRSALVWPRWLTNQTRPTVSFVYIRIWRRVILSKEWRNDKNRDWFLGTECGGGGGWIRTGNRYSGVSRSKNIDFHLTKPSRIRHWSFNFIFISIIISFFLLFITNFLDSFSKIFTGIFGW